MNGLPRRPSPVYARALDLLTRGTANLAGLLLLSTVVANALAIVFRYLIGQPLIWTEEVQRYLMIWVAFLGGAACLGRDDHMAMDLFVGLLSGRLRRIVRLVLLALSAVLGAVLAWKGIPLAVENAAQLSPAARIPMCYPYLAVGVGGLLLLAIALLRIGLELSPSAAQPEPSP